MSLVERINNDLKQAMLKKDEAGLRAIRAIKAAIIIAQTEKGGSKDLTEDTEIKLLQKLVKQRKDSLEIYKQQNRADLATKEQEELDVIEKYLPAQMSDDDLKAELRKIISQTGAQSPQEMGKVIGIAMKQLAGKADGKKISELVKQLLTK
jgi:uncharacterized protein YqeY